MVTCDALTELAPIEKMVVRSMPQVNLLEDAVECEGEVVTADYGADLDLLYR